MLHEPPAAMASALCGIVEARSSETRAADLGDANSSINIYTDVGNGCVGHVVKIKGCLYHAIMLIKNHDSGLEFDVEVKTT